jgi:hypothetical protein
MPEALVEAMIWQVTEVDQTWVEGLNGISVLARTMSRTRSPKKIVHPTMVYGHLSVSSPSFTWTPLTIRSTAKSLHRARLGTLRQRCVR